MGRQSTPGAVVEVDDPLGDAAWRDHLAYLWSRVEEDLAHEAAVACEPWPDEMPDEVPDPEAGDGLPPDPFVRDDLDGPPGSRAAAALEELRRAPALRSDAGALVVAAAGARRLETWAVHHQLEAIADLLRLWSVSDDAPRPARRRGYDVDPAVLVRESVVTEVALAFGVGEKTASDRVSAAEALLVDERLPEAAALLAEGRLDWPRVTTIVTRTWGLTPDRARAVDAAVTPDAPRLTLPALRRRLDVEILRVDEQAAAERVDRARRERRVCLDAAIDGPGVAQLWAIGPAEAVTAAYEGLDAAARHLRSAGDPRTLDQLRHDLLVTACTTGGLPAAGATVYAATGALPGRRATTGEPAAVCATGPGAPPGEPTGPPLPGGQPHDGGTCTSECNDTCTGPCDRAAPWFTSTFPDVTPTVAVTVSLETLLGLTDDPAFLGDHGTVPAQLARDLAATGIWRCIAVDDTHGTVLGVASNTFTPGYVPGARLKKFLEHAAPRCSMTGCRTRAARCDVDHRRPHADGGSTCSCNAQLLCRRHHRLKTAGLLTAEPSTDPADPTGTVMWTTRAGRTYSGRPHVPLPHVTDARRRARGRAGGDSGGSGPPPGAPPS